MTDAKHTTKNKCNSYDYHVLIAAAGAGLRTGLKKPKQYIEVNKGTILTHTIENIKKWPGNKSISVIINPDHIKLYEKSTEDLNILPPVFGGHDRSKSIQNALEKAAYIKDHEIVLIHDAARPYTNPEDVSNLLHCMQSTDAATLAAKVTDTLRKASIHQNADKIIDRKNLWAIQTPQAFKAGILRKAHSASTNLQNATDDTSLISGIGHDIKIIESHFNNEKITFKKDIEMAKNILGKNKNMQYETRSGIGFDVHAFDNNKKVETIRLCGIDVPHKNPLSGHSDADVALHTITDALLGALGEGDIGQHFPPTDITYRNMDSAKFLKKPLEFIRKRGGQIINIDLTIIGENPKIGPHISKMKTRLSSLLNLEETRINIKATTTEKLGFTGREEGLAAQAIANVKLPIDT